MKDHPVEPLQQPPSLRQEWPLLVVVGLAVLALDVYSLPPSITLEDSGLFVMAADAAGVAHPPGYPLHTLLGKLFTWLPVGSVAWRVNLLSAVFGALTCAVVAWLARALTGSRVAAVVAGLACGAGREMWAQSIVAEVYTINTFLYFLLFATALHYRTHGQRAGLNALALLIGLGLSHHWPLFVLSLPSVGLVLWPRRREVLARALGAARFLLIGLLPLAYLVARSQLQPSISFYGPIGSLSELFEFVLRKGYAGADTSGTATGADRLLFAKFLCRELADQFTWAGAAVAGFGLWSCRRRVGAGIAMALAAGFLGSTFLLLLLLNRDYSFISAAVFRPYPLIAYGIMALWLGLGIAALSDLLSARFGPRGRWMAPTVGAALVIAAIGTHGGRNVRRAYAWASTHAHSVLEILEPNSVLIVSGDTDTGSIGYLNRVEGVRPDVTVVNALGLVFADGPVPPLATTQARTDALERFIRSTDRPVFTTAPLPFAYGSVNCGPVTKVLPGKPGHRSFHSDPQILAYCDRIEADRTQTDPWTIDHRNEALSGCGRHLALVNQFSPGHAPVQSVLARVQATWPGGLAAVDELGPYVAPEILLPALAKAEALLDDTAAKPARASVHGIRGHLLLQRDPAAAVASFERAIDLYPHADNSAVLTLLETYAAQGRAEAFFALRDRIYGNGPVPPAVLELQRLLAR